MPLLFIDGYPFDLIITQDSSYPGEVTEHAVDADADLNDHIRTKAMEITLACVVSDTPSGEIELHPTRAAEPTPPLHSEAAFDKLLEIRDRRRPVTVETPRRTFINMGMTSLERQESVDSSGGLLFTVSFRQLRILTNKRVTVRVGPPLAKGGSNLGNRQGKNVAMKKILWRKGSPPGTSPATDPPGKIVGQEYILSDLVAGKDGTPFFHMKPDGSTGKRLTTEELQAFTLDFNRDDALEQRRKLATIDQRVAETGDRIDRALKYANARDQNPGQYVDRKLFGL